VILNPSVQKYKWQIEFFRYFTCNLDSWAVCLAFLRRYLRKKADFFANVLVLHGNWLIFYMSTAKSRVSLIR
jgi:hypothetical protein